MAKRRKGAVLQLRPDQSLVERLDQTLARIRQLTNEGERLFVDMFLALAELYEHKELWSIRYEEFDELLKSEGFCTPHTFDGFMRAYNEFGVNEVRRLGVRASVLLINQAKNVRTKVLTVVNEWFKEHSVPPSYQRVTAFTQQAIGAATKRKTRAESKDEKILRLNSRVRALVGERNTLKKQVETLSKENWRLRGALKRHGLKVPS